MRSLIEALRTPSTESVKSDLRTAYKHARERSKVLTTTEAVGLLLKTGVSPKDASEVFAENLLDERPIRNVVCRLGESSDGLPDEGVFRQIIRDIVWERMEVGIKRCMRN